MTLLIYFQVDMTFVYSLGENMTLGAHTKGKFRLKNTSKTYMILRA